MPDIERFVCYRAKAEKNLNIFLNSDLALP